MVTERKEGGWMRALYLGALVIGSVVIFALGVMVGSNVNLPPEAFRADRRPSPAAGPGGVAPARREEIPLPPKGVEVKGEDMSFYKTLAEPSRPEPAPIGTAVEPVPTPAPAGAPGSMTVTGAPAGAAVPEKPAPAPAGSAKAEAPSAPVARAETAGAPPEKMWSVQVMLTSDKDEAQATVAALAKEGFDGFTAPVTRKGGRYLAVRAGRMAAEAEARKLLAEVKKKTRYKDAFVVKE